MFDLRRIPISRALLPFAGGAGIGLAEPPLGGLSEPASLNLQLWFLLILCCLVFLQVLLYRSRIFPAAFKAHLFFVLTFILFCISGWMTSLVDGPSDPDLPLDRKLFIRGKIAEGPIAGKNTLRFGMETRILCFGDSSLVMKTRLQVHWQVFARDSASGLPRPGETWHMYGRLVPIANLGNPGAPDYKLIMSRKNCWYRFYPDRDGIPKGRGEALCKLILEDKRLSASRIRRLVSAHWKGRESELSLLKAVCLGDRSELTRDMKQAYAHAGAMHLLAVSGLHLGLIWWVLYRMFSWMTRISGKEYFRSLTIVALLWMFAYVSGFSASVNRAACMFTLFTAGRLMDRSMHHLNAILVSAFLLILIRPQVLLHVGFQLSYAAILGIVCMYPVLRGLLRIKNQLLRRVGDACLVSLSAQLSTAPLVIYYFHQIPLYSVVTSLITIPLLSALICLFVISVPFALANIGFAWLNALLVNLAGLMNFIVEAVASFPGAVLEGLPMTPASLCLWMGIWITVLLRLHHRKTVLNHLIFFLLALSLWPAAWKHHRLKYSSELQISHVYKASVLSFREGLEVDHFCWCGDSVSSSYLSGYLHQRWNRRCFHSTLIQVDEEPGGKGRIAALYQLTPAIWLVGNDQCKGWLISGAAEHQVGDGQKYPNERLRIPPGNFLLLSAGPRLEKIPREMLTGAELVILDASNPNWYFTQIDRLSRNLSVNFELYSTGKQGAYLKRW